MNEKILQKLASTLKKRKKEMPRNSYVSKLIKKGKVKIANKLGEEAFETVSAFLSQEKNDILEESADLIFHLMVLLEYSDLSFDDVLAILKKRMKDD